MSTQLTKPYRGKFLVLSCLAIFITVLIFYVFTTSDERNVMRKIDDNLNIQSNGYGAHPLTK